jgi:hypothetical protein
VKIKNPKPIAGSKNIPPAPELNENAEIRFSFRYLDIHSNAKFTLSHCDENYLEKLLLRLKDINSATLKEFRQFNRAEMRNHLIVFSDTSEPNGFTCLNGQLRAKEAWQFQITKSTHGRVHGLLINETFFIVWLDPCHKLYPGNGDCNH